MIVIIVESIQVMCLPGSIKNMIILQLLKDDLWPNPLQYYLVPDIEFECDNAENSDELEEEEEQFDDDDGKFQSEANYSIFLTHS